MSFFALLKPTHKTSIDQRFISPRINFSGFLLKVNEWTGRHGANAVKPWKVPLLIFTSRQLVLKRKKQQPKSSFFCSCSRKFVVCAPVGRLCCSCVFRMYFLIRNGNETFLGWGQIKGAEVICAGDRISKLTKIDHVEWDELSQQRQRTDENGGDIRLAFLLINRERI